MSRDHDKTSSGAPGDPWGRWRRPEAAEPAGESAAPVAATPAVVASAPVTSSEAPAVDAAEEGAVRKTLTVTRKPAPVAQPAKPVGKAARPGGKPTGKPAGKTGSGREGAKAPWTEGRRSGDEMRSSRREGTAERPPRERKPLVNAESPWARAVPASKPAYEQMPERPVVKQPQTSEQSGVRLSKVMSERGICSRREADLWIERGWVFVNGEVVSELGSRIDPAAEVTISKDAEKNQAKQVTILLNKPVGYVSGQPEPDCVPAVTLIGLENQVVQTGDPEFKPWMLRGLAPAGRLDVDSTGLLVLTSDGRVAKKLIGNDSDTEKEYLVRVSGQMIKDGLDLLRHGLELDGKPLRQAWVKQLNEDQLHFILKEGKKRQIRRMCELVGLKVIGLKRVRIGRIRLGDLPMGQWRFLREGEAF